MIDFPSFSYDTVDFHSFRARKHFWDYPVFDLRRGRRKMLTVARTACCTVSLRVFASIPFVFAL